MGSIIYYPYEKPDGSNRDSKVLPVYNGLRVTVDSDYKGRIGFKYVSDVLDNLGGLGVLTTLKHNKDLNDGYGYFDFGRVIESTLNGEKLLNSSYTTIPTNAVRQPKKINSFAPIFKEEFSRNLILDTATAIPLGGGAYNNIFSFTEPHLLRVGDVVYITNNGSNVLNFTVQSVVTNKIVSFINGGGGNFISTLGINSSMDFTECEKFVDNYFYNGNVGFIIPAIRPTRIEVGDRVFIRQYGNPTNTEYDGEAKITSIESVNIGGTSYKILVTDKAFRDNTPAEPGFLYSRENYLIEGNINYNETINSFNGVIPYEEYPNWDFNPYRMDESVVGKFLTNEGKPNNTPLQTIVGDPVTRIIDVDRDDYHTLSTVRGAFFDSVDWTHIQYYFYDENFTLQSSSSEVMSFDDSTSGIFDIGVGAKNFEAQPSFDDTIKYVVLNLSRDPASFTDCSEKIMIRINEPKCERYDKYRFKFMNQLGQWDYYNFTKRSDETISMERSVYRQRLNRGRSGNYSYQVGDRGNTTYNVNAQRSIEVSTDWLSSFDKNYLEELFLSPMVYHIKDGQQLPITITTNELQKGLDSNYGLFRYTINFDYSYKINTHRL